jgi:hypothetical protein
MADHLDDPPPPYRAVIEHDIPLGTVAEREAFEAASRSGQAEPSNAHVDSGAHHASYPVGTTVLAYWWERLWLARVVAINARRHTYTLAWADGDETVGYLARHLFSTDIED